MQAESGITLAAKCAPDERLLSLVCESGIKAVEIYTDERTMEDIDSAASLCRGFPLRYALHAPNAGYEPAALLRLSEAVGAEVAVTHAIYFDDEWREMGRLWRGSGVRLCIENISSVHEPAKFMRRFGFGMCLDLEHLQMECAGVFEEEFVRFIGRASHIHLTGYSYGSQDWHTHLNQNPGHGEYMLGLVNKAGYSGLVVSEARTSLQKVEDFASLREFFSRWAESAGAEG